MPSSFRAAIRGSCLCVASLYELGANLVELTLMQEDLQHQYQATHGRQALHEVPHIFRSLWSIGRIEADVKVQSADCLFELDDGHLGLGYNLHAMKLCQSFDLQQPAFLFYKSSRSLPQ